jgi:phage repressor protein C with HTH and peptisase S24 domain
LRRGDRVVLKTTEGEIMVTQLVRRGGRRVDVMALNGAQAEAGYSVDQVAFVHRIIWVSQ